MITAQTTMQELRVQLPGKRLRYKAGLSDLVRRKTGAKKFLENNWNLFSYEKRHRLECYIDRLNQAIWRGDFS